MSNKKELNASELGKVSGGSTTTGNLLFKYALGTKIKIKGCSSSGVIRKRGFIKTTSEICYYIEAPESDNDAGKVGWYLESNINSDRTVTVEPITSEAITIVDSFL